MSNIIGIILIICFLVMTYAFAQLAVGRKKGDAQIMKDLKKENDLLSAKNAWLQRKLDKITTDRAQRIMNKLKLGGLGHKTTFVKFNEASKD